MAKARAQQAAADLSVAAVAKQQALDGIALEVRQDYLNLTDARERLSVANAAVAEAQEQYRLSKVRYAAGVTQIAGASPLLEVSDAQTALTQALTNQVNARYDVYGAKSAVGQSDWPVRCWRMLRRRRDRLHEGSGAGRGEVGREATDLTVRGRPGQHGVRGLGCAFKS